MVAPAAETLERLYEMQQSAIERAELLDVSESTGVGLSAIASAKAFGTISTAPPIPPIIPLHDRRDERKQKPSLIKIKVPGQKPIPMGFVDDLNSRSALLGLTTKVNRWGNIFVYVADSQGASRAMAAMNAKQWGNTG
jgi:hypothetical protein